MLIDTSNDQTVKTTLNRWLKQINNYETLKPTLQNVDNAKAIIDAPENKDIMDKAYLLQALVYFSKEDFLKTKQSFAKLQILWATYLSMQWKIVFYKTSYVRSSFLRL